MLFLTRIALWKHRVQLPGFELPKPVDMAQQEFDHHSPQRWMVWQTGWREIIGGKRYFQTLPQVSRSDNSDLLFGKIARRGGSVWSISFPVPQNRKSNPLL